MSSAAQILAADEKRWTPVRRGAIFCSPGYTAYVNGGAWTALDPVEAVRMAREAVQQEALRIAALLDINIPRLPEKT